MRWETWEVKQVVTLWKQGASSGEIGGLIGRTGAQVRSFVKNNRDRYGLEPKTDDSIAAPNYDPDYYYLPKYHWLIRKSWSDV
jgi:hypothetical protein